MLVHRIKINKIKQFVSEEFEIPIRHIDSHQRNASYVRPRHVAMMLAVKYSGASLPKIGRNFGGKDHTTIIHAQKSIQNHLERDPILREKVNRVTKKIEDFLSNGGKEDDIKKNYLNDEMLSGKNSEKLESLREAVAGSMAKMVELTILESTYCDPDEAIAFVQEACLKISSVDL